MHAYMIIGQSQQAYAIHATMHSNLLQRLPVSLHACKTVQHSWHPTITPTLLDPWCRSGMHEMPIKAGLHISVEHAAIFHSKAKSPKRCCSSLPASQQPG